MRVVKNLVKTMQEEHKKSVYCYRVVKGVKLGVQAYGIEVERLDMEGEEIINIERNAVEGISPQPHKVYDLVNILYNNLVSPLHLVDIIGEFVDLYIEDFDNDFKRLATN